jgi:hypothetical protein
MERVELKAVSSEFEGARLGDARLERRALKVVDTLSTAPDESFPTLLADDSELEALYRFLNNERVTAERLLEPHYRATARRAEAAGRVLVIHDTTGFTFGGQTRRKGLGRMKSGGAHASQGFYAHLALVAAVDSGAPLGVIGVVPVVRNKPPLAYPDVQSKRHSRRREFERWGKLVDLSCERLAGQRCIHVMDREGDAYTLFCQLSEKNQDFVIRSKDDRILDVPRGDQEQPRLLHEAVECGRYVMSREVQLSTKRPDKMARLRKAPGRRMRKAKLDVVVTSVDVRHPPFTAGQSRRDSGLPRAVSLNVVHVREKAAPPGQQPVSWLLLTNLPIDTVEAVDLVIDSYRHRWLIEEYNKALKSGCALEKRQLESKHALLNALALFVPIAWRLLTLRTLSRETPDAPASRVLSDRQLQILRARKKVQLDRNPTIYAAMLAIAAEGGHIKNNGDPGWQVLGRGYEKLLYMELGYLLAQKTPQK